MFTEHTNYQIILAAGTTRAALLRASLVEQNYRVIDTITNFGDALFKLTKYNLTQATAIVIDAHLPNSQTDTSSMGIKLAEFVRKCYSHIGIIIIDDGTYLEETQNFFLTAQGSGFAYLLNSHIPLHHLEAAISYIRAGHIVVENPITRKLVLLNRNRADDNKLAVYVKFCAAMIKHKLN
jgi:DNA-binding NarL/FixJ family response regulator